MIKTTNAGVLDAFLAGDSAKSGSLTATNATPQTGAEAVPVLISYETEIAYKVGRIVYVNPRRYSVTTSKQRNQLIRKLGDRVPTLDHSMYVLGPKEPYCARRRVYATFHAYHLDD